MPFSSCRCLCFRVTALQTPVNHCRCSAPNSYGKVMAPVAYQQVRSRTPTMPGCTACSLVKHTCDIWVAAPVGAEHGRGVCNTLPLHFVEYTSVTVKLFTLACLGAILPGTSCIGRFDRDINCRCLTRVRSQCEDIRRPPSWLRRRQPLNFASCCWVSCRESCEEGISDPIVPASRIPPGATKSVIALSIQDVRSARCTYSITGSEGASKPQLHGGGPLMRRQSRSHGWVERGNPRMALMCVS